jgi:acetyl-CoA carboxylase biotin carboxyl carrier protein
LQETILPDNVDLEQLKELVRLVEEHNLAELTIEEQGITITVKGAASVASTVYVEHPTPTIAGQVPAAPPSVSPVVPAQPHAVEQSILSNLVKIESPMVGVFYKASSPDSPPFIEVGDVLEVGQTIGLIEAMKVFSEIPSEVAGEVVEISVENGQLVQQGQTLVVVRPSVSE